jgi:hypothetical protein
VLGARVHLLKPNLCPSHWLISFPLVCVVEKFSIAAANEVHFGSHQKSHASVFLEILLGQLGEPHLLLGIKIDHDHAKGCITISQGEYIHKVLASFNMADCSPAVMPMDTSVKLEPTSDATCFKHPSTYHSAVRALLYAVMGTRPNIAYAVQTLSQFSKDPAVEHWTAVK